MQLLLRKSQVVLRIGPCLMPTKVCGKACLGAGAWGCLGCHAHTGSPGSGCWEIPAMQSSQMSSCGQGVHPDGGSCWGNLLDTVQQCSRQRLCGSCHRAMPRQKESPCNTPGGMHQLQKLSIVVGWITGPEQTGCVKLCGGTNVLWWPANCATERRAPTGADLVRSLEAQGDMHGASSATARQCRACSDGHGK